MAVVSQNQSDNQEDQNQQGSSNGQPNSGNSGGVTTVVSGSKGGSGGSSNAAPTVQNAQQSSSGTGSSSSGQPSSSGSFTNLKSYLNANNGGQQFTNQINNNLNQQGQQLQTNVNNATQQFNNQAQSVVNPLQQNYQNFQQNGGSSGDANAITNYANQSQDNASSIKNLENASYTGPKSLNDLSGANNGAALQSNINNYSTLANSTATQPGRFSLLQNMFGNQGYSQGQQTLDNMFVDPSKLSGSRATANQAQNAYNQASNQATNTAQNDQNQVAGMATGTVGGLNNAINNQYSNVQNETAEAVAKQQQAVQNFIQSYNNGNISQADATALGLTNGQTVYNLDPTKYVTQAATPTLQTVANSQDYGNFSALQGLLGNNTNTQTSSILSQFTDPSKAGQTGNPYSLDQQGYQAALASAKDAYNQAINPVNQNISQINGDNGYLSAANAGDTNAMYMLEHTSNPAMVNQLEQWAGGNWANAGTQYNPDGHGSGLWSTNTSPGTQGLEDLDQAALQAQQQALQNLATQYGANKTLNFT